MPTGTSLYSLEKSELEEKARGLMRQYDVFGAWRLKWMPRAKRTLGRCEPAVSPCLLQREDYPGEKGAIKLSKNVFADLGLEVLTHPEVPEGLFTDTVLHEVAHARDFEARGTSGHDWPWRRQAEEVGADPSRCTNISKSIRRLMAKWIRYCPECGHEVFLYRKPGKSARPRSCGRCSSSWNPRYELELRRNPDQIL